MHLQDCSESPMLHNTRYHVALMGGPLRGFSLPTFPLPATVQRHALEGFYACEWGMVDCVC